MGYIKCPRCNLNYIDESSETLCRVCLMETGKIAAKKDDEYDDDMELCPECGENLMRVSETMCASCASLMEQRKEDVKDIMDDFSDIAEDSNNMEDEDIFVSIEEMAYNEGEPKDDEQDMME